MEENHKSSKESKTFCEKICKAFSNARPSKTTRPVAYQYQTPAFPKAHLHVQTTKQEMGHNKIAEKEEPHHNNKDHYRRSGSDHLNNRISEYLNRVGKKIRTTSFVGHEHACPTNENISHLDERVEDYIHRAKKKISATSSSVGMGKHVLFKGNK